MPKAPSWQHTSSALRSRRTRLAALGGLGTAQEARPGHWARPATASGARAWFATSKVADATASAHPGASVHTTLLMPGA